MSNNMTYSQMAQLELMNAAANVNSQEDLDALKLTLSLFFAEKAQREIDQMWEDGTLDQSKLDELRGQHLRTPYRTYDTHLNILKQIPFPKLTILTLDEFNEELKGVQ